MSEKAASIPKVTPTVNLFAPPPGSGKQPDAPPPKEGVVQWKLDGRWVESPPGLNLIEAARRHGVHIPYYCYHSRLSVAGQCRMCLVDASGVGPPGKLSPGCQILVSEGMVVNTQSPAVAEARRAVMEFHLVNHPVDCSICDQSGECKLQDYYMAYDHKPSRLNAYKVVKAKRVILGPQVVLDQERCIMCTRCVRFMSEIAKEPQLGVVYRGDHSMIDIFPGQPLDSNYSLNTVDICPVGALLSRDFRFTSRVWFLKMTATVCDGCSRGCNARAEWKGETVYRLTPRENRAVNDVWLCDAGRLTYHAVNEGRVLVPRLGRAQPPTEERGPAAPAPGQAQASEIARQAAQAAAEKLRPLVGQGGVAVALGATASTEDLLAWAQLAREELKLDRVYLLGRPSGTADHFLLRSDKNPNTAGAHLAAEAFGLSVASYDALVQDVRAGTVKALWMVGESVPVDPAVAAAELDRLELLGVQARNASALTDRADVLLPASSHLESAGTFVNGDGRLQRFFAAFRPRGVSLPHWGWASEIGRALGLAQPWGSAEAVFDALAARSELLQGLRFALIPEQGVQLSRVPGGGDKTGAPAGSLAAPAPPNGARVRTPSASELPRAAVGGMP